MFQNRLPKELYLAVYFKIAAKIHIAQLARQMNKSEVRKILALYNSQDWSEYSTYYDLEVKNKYDSKPKRNTWVHIDRIPKFSFVKELINKDLKELDLKYIASEFITLLVYEKGDYFAEHQDGSSGVVVKSGGYALNTDYTGGEFMLEGTAQDYKVGELFYFNRNVLHEVRPVSSGKRLSLHFGILKKTDSLI